MKHITRVEGSITKEREDRLSHTHLLLREEARRLEMRALMYLVTWAPETGARKGKIRRIVLPFWLARTKPEGYLHQPYAVLGIKGWMKKNLQ